MPRQDKINVICPVCLKERTVNKYQHGKLCKPCRNKRDMPLLAKKGRRKHNLIGQKFGHLLVIGIGNTVSGKAGWICRCVCGKEFVVRNLKTTKSCDCIKRTQKGLSTSRAYKSYGCMMSRCYIKTNNHFHLYGKRGIKVCDRWKESFLNFFEDMGEREKGHSLDRINVNGDYCKENCRWATSKEQGKNRRNSILIEAFGKKKNSREWSEVTGINRQTIDYRLKSGWTHEEALTFEVSNNRKYHHKKLKAFNPIV